MKKLQTILITNSIVDLKQKETGVDNMLLLQDPFFCDPIKDLCLPVIELTVDDIKRNDLSEREREWCNNTLWEMEGLE